VWGKGSKRKKFDRLRGENGRRRTGKIEKEERKREGGRKRDYQ
jgi:hypothetical protein